MTTTVAHLIEFLRQFPHDTNVEVMGGRGSRGYEGMSYSRVDMELPSKPLEWMDDKPSAMFEKHVEYYNGDLLLGFDD